MVIGMEERASPQVDSLGQVAMTNHDETILRKTPFRPNLCPVSASLVCPL